MIVEQKIIGRDHGDDGSKQAFCDQQAEEILTLLKSMGLYDEFHPPSGHYPTMLIPGGATSAFEGRLPWMKKPDITADRVVILAGERPIDEVRDQAEELFLPEDSDDAWTRWVLAKGRENLTETHIARIMLQRMIGETTLRAVAGGSHQESRDTPKTTTLTCSTKSKTKQA